MGLDIQIRTSVGEGMEKTELSLHPWWSNFEKCLEVPKIVTHRGIPFDLFLLLGVYPRVMEIYVHTNSHRNVHIHITHSSQKVGNNPNVQ